MTVYGLYSNFYRPVPVLYFGKKIRYPHEIGERRLARGSRKAFKKKGRLG